jgi:hypothetical protein
MPNDFGWVAIGTFGLGMATVWLGWQTRQARIEAQSTDERRILRAALAQQLDNCRLWVTRDPARGEASFERLRRATPRLEALQSMIHRLDLQADVVLYIVWLIGTINDWWAQIDHTLNTPTGPNGTPRVNQQGLPDEWRVMVERLQVAAALVAGEARRRGFDDLAGPYDKSPWVVVPMWEERGRQSVSMTDVSSRGAPPFPADSSFAEATPTARDHAGAQTGDRQRAFLLDRDDPVGRLLRKR